MTTKEANHSACVSLKSEMDAGLWRSKGGGKSPWAVIGLIESSLKTYRDLGINPGSVIHLSWGLRQGAEPLWDFSF